LKIWAPLSSKNLGPLKLFTPPGVPSWLRAGMQLVDQATDVDLVTST